MRKIVSQRNCRACHVVNRAGRAIGPMIADTNFLPPDLTPQGGRAQSPWLFSFLKDPTVMKIRPWMNVRMPTFGFNDHEAATIVAGFAAEGNEPQFETKRFEIPAQQNVAIGREVYTMLRCAQCHSTTPVDPANPPLPNVAAAQSLAPNLTLSKLRLRHDWIADWIRRPGEMIPDTRMPANFPRDPETGGFRSPLAGAIDTPQFAGHKAALLPYFENEEALRKTMSDAVALTEYLRDYIWSVGLNQMRNPGAGPVGPAPPAVQQPTTLPALPVAERRRPGGWSGGVPAAAPRR
jgi:cytochrome c2